MRRVLFATILLVLLLGTFGTALAQDAAPAQLGEVWSFWVIGLWPGEGVDVYLNRPATYACDDIACWTEWPFATGPNWGTWFWTGEGSWDRRQSYPAYQAANEYGIYYAEFMLPRDEVWYPCSYPYKWNCNYVVDPINFGIDYHSPAWQGNFEPGLDWPYYDWFTAEIVGDWDMALAMADPQDTVSPLVVKWVSEFGYGNWWEFEVDGYYWKWSDLEDGFYYIGVAP